MTELNYYQKLKFVMESNLFSPSDCKLFYFLHQEENINGVFHSTVEGLSRACNFNKRTTMKGIAAFEREGIIETVQKVKGRNAGFAWIFSDRYTALHKKYYEQKKLVDLKTGVLGLISSGISIISNSPDERFLSAIRANYRRDPYLPIPETLQLLSRKFKQ